MAIQKALRTTYYRKGSRHWRAVVVSLGEGRSDREAIGKGRESGRFGSEGWRLGGGRACDEHDWSASHPQPNEYKNNSKFFIKGERRGLMRQQHTGDKGGGGQGRGQGGLGSLEGGVLVKCVRLVEEWAGGADDQ